MVKGEKIGVFVLGIFSIIIVIFNIMMAWYHNPQGEYSENPFAVLSLGIVTFLVFFVGSAFVLGCAFLLCRKIKIKVSNLFGAGLGALSFAVFFAGYICFLLATV